MYVRTYICMCVCMYVRTYICKYVRTYVCTYICKYVCIYVCVCVYVCMYIHVYTGHGKTRAYLHRFKLLESATCPCGMEEQTTDHLIYCCIHGCILLQQPRETLNRETSKQGMWPINKQELITKHLKPFMKFTNAIDFDKL